uniref:Ig-like domain-containing protein n=1 Tax=Cairina moschata TaxID=8855 RepID=A0A8C3GIU3_CAIMO
MRSCDPRPGACPRGRAIQGATGGAAAHPAVPCRAGDPQQPPTFWGCCRAWCSPSCTEAGGNGAAACMLGLVTAGFCVCGFCCCCCFFFSLGAFYLTSTRGPDIRGCSEQEREKAQLRGGGKGPLGKVLAAPQAGQARKELGQKRATGALLEGLQTPLLRSEMRQTRAATSWCEDRAVPAGGELWLLPKEPLQAWVKLEWKVTLDSGTTLVIVRASKDEAPDFRSNFSGRATFHPETLSLNISMVTQADSGNYYAGFDTESGLTHSQCFHVSVWEPIGQPQLEVRVLQQEQGWCNFSLLCSVPGAADVSYSWSHDGEPLGHENVLRVHGDTEPRTYICNASNPVSWNTASIDPVTACLPPGTGPSILWWAVAVLLVLAVSLIAFVACWCWRKRRKDGSAAPPGHVEPSMTVYEEVGKVQAGQDLNRNREANVVGNTIYAVVSTKAQGPRHFQEPQSCTIYSTIQPTKKSPSIRRKKLDPALVCTAYTEPTVPLKHWSIPPRTSSLSPVDNHHS